MLKGVVNVDDDDCACCAVALLCVEVMGPLYSGPATYTCGST